MRGEREIGVKKGKSRNMSELRKFDGKIEENNFIINFKVWSNDFEFFEKAGRRRDSKGKSTRIYRQGAKDAKGEIQRGWTQIIYD